MEYADFAQLYHCKFVFRKKVQPKQIQLFLSSLSWIVEAEFKEVAE